MSELEPLDTSCWKLVELVLQRLEEDWWFGKLKKASQMNDKPFRTHFNHLLRYSVIEYLAQEQKKGKPKLFRLRLDQHLFMVWWPQRVVGLAREALEIFGGIDGPMVIKDISDMKKVRGGAFLIEHGREGVELNLQQPRNLLVIEWRYLKKNETLARTNFIPGSGLPQIDQLIELLRSKGEQGVNA